MRPITFSLPRNPRCSYSTISCSFLPLPSSDEQASTNLWIRVLRLSCVSVMFPRETAFLTIWNLPDSPGCPDHQARLVPPAKSWMFCLEGGQVGQWFDHWRHVAVQIERDQLCQSEMEHDSATDSVVQDQSSSLHLSLFCVNSMYIVLGLVPSVAMTLPVTTRYTNIGKQVFQVVCDNRTEAHAHMDIGGEVKKWCSFWARML